jgi:hypothetical protein
VVTFGDAAYEVLKKNGKPMRLRDMTPEVLELKESKGRFPVVTLRIAMYRDTKQRFRRVSFGRYGLTEWKKQKGAAPVQERNK